MNRTGEPHRVPAAPALPGAVCCGCVSKLHELLIQRMGQRFCYSALWDLWDLWGRCLELLDLYWALLEDAESPVLESASDAASESELESALELVSADCAVSDSSSTSTLLAPELLATVSV